MESRYEYILWDAPNLPAFDWIEKEDEEEKMCLNGDEIEDIDENNRICSWLKKTFKKVKICPYCKTTLKQAQFRWTNYEGEEGPFRKYSRVWVCLNCIYWQAYWKDTWSDTEPFDYGLVIELFILSELQKYEHDLPKGVGSELAQFLRRNPKHWHKISPKRFEKLIASIYKANFSDAEVLHIGKPHDGGVDVYGIRSSGLKWMIQAKCRGTEDKIEGVNTIRNLLGSMVLNDGKFGIVASTANHFSYFAYKAIGQARKKGIIIEVWDKGKLNKLLDPLLKDRPWLDVLSRLDQRVLISLTSKIPKSMGFQQFTFDFLAGEN